MGKTWRWAMLAWSSALVGCMAAGPAGPAPAASPLAVPTVAPADLPPVLPPARALAPNEGRTSTVAWDDKYLLDLAVGPDGRAYALTLGGVYHLAADGGTAEKVAEAGNEFTIPGIDAERTIAYPTGIGVALDGTILVTAIQGLYLLRPGGTLERAAPPDARGSYSAMVGDWAGNVYVASRFGTRVFRRDPAGAWRTFAGRDVEDVPQPVPATELFADGAGAAARFGGIADLAVDRHGRVLVADHGNGAIRRITPDGEVSTLWGPTRHHAEGPSPPPEARPLPTPTPQVVPGPGLPRAVAVGPDDTVYFACTDNRIRRLAPAGTATVLAGDGTYCQHLACMDTCPSPEPWSCYQDGPGALARFDEVEAMGVAADGALYVLDGGPMSELKRLRVVR